MTRIALVQGHPDPRPAHFAHALAQAYADGAREGGHELRTITVAQLEVPLLASKDDWDHGEAPADVKAAQEVVAWAQHLVIVYPLWLGSMPARLKAFLEQLLRPGFAMRIARDGRWTQLLKGRSARIVVTMGMPAFLYRWYFRAHSVKSLTRNILQFVGVKPVRTTLIGMVEGKPAPRARRLQELRALGRAGR